MEHQYFCIDCKMSLCPDCYIEEHHSHARERLNEVYALVKANIDDSYDHFKKYKEEVLMKRVAEVDALLKK